MTTLGKELEQRLKKLETEQNKQDVALTELNTLEKEIRELEDLLAKIDSSYTLAITDPETDYTHLRDLKEIEKFEQKLAHIDEEFEAELTTQTEQPQPLPQKESVKKEDTAQPQPVATPTSVNPTSTTYVICLMFNPKSPPEWSGKGWCERGKGMRYTSPALAKQTLQKLKKQWPDYPLKIFKR